MSLLAQTPKFDLSDAERFSKTLFGVDPTAPIKKLPSERDQNFLIETSGGQFVLKISNSAETREKLEAQNQMISRLADSDDHGCVQVLKSINGNMIESVDSGNQRHLVRLVTFVKGDSMASLSGYSDELLYDLGRRIGKMTNELEGFDHPALHSDDFHWDLANGVSVVQRHLVLLDDGVRRRCVEILLSRFKRHTVPLLEALPCSVIHNDANDGNLIVGATESAVTANRIVGVVDFGDSIWSWTVGELAIAIAYAILEHADPIAAMCEVVDGYLSERKLTEQEASALYGLVCIRLCTSVVMAAEQQRQRPDDPYLSVSQSQIVNTLPLLAEVPFEFVEALVREKCGFVPLPKSSVVDRWLAANKSNFVFPVGENRPADDELLVLDLGVTSPHLSGDPASIQQVDLSKIINDSMDSGNAKVVVGRYLEPGLVYRSRQFASKSAERESRTIHLGVDLFVDSGTSVRAPFDGEVFLVNDNKDPLDYGPLVILEHKTDSGEQFFSLYGHLSRDSILRLSVGQKVSAGEAFATLGGPHENGGWPPHLHFQLTLDLMELGTDFPGVCRPSRVAIWTKFCPDPNLVLQIPQKLFPTKAVSNSETRAKRDELLGGNLSLGYRRPVKLVRGWKQYLFDSGGQKYLDAYNNVPHVGHCHPRVVGAMHSQAARLNTNTRYLGDEINQYAEALAATMPAGLEVCYFVNSASEANELALRMARAKTGGYDLIVLEGAYHGHTTSLIDISPYKHDGPGGAGAADWVHTAPVADIYRGAFRDPSTAGANYAAAVGSVLDNLKANGRQLSGFIAESCPSVGGQILFPDGYLKDVYQRVRAAGGLCIADDVQTGYGRLGKWFYGFEQQDVTPDIVVLGKPIGNGHPIAALVTTREIAGAFDNGMEFFSTFGGNTVSSIVGKTVLDIVREEELQDHAEEVGEFLLKEFFELKNRHSIIGDVRGSGFFLGIELVRDHQSLEPADREASFVANRMRDRRILIGTDGPLHNVLKIRPPMPFGLQDANELIRALDKSLSELS